MLLGSLFCGSWLSTPGLAGDPWFFWMSDAISILTYISEEMSEAYNTVCHRDATCASELSTYDFLLSTFKYIHHWLY